MRILVIIALFIIFTSCEKKTEEVKTCNCTEYKGAESSFIPGHWDIYFQQNWTQGCESKILEEHIIESEFETVTHRHWVECN